MHEIPQDKLKELENFAMQVRRDIVTMVYKAKSGHPGGALGMADIFTILYQYHAKLQPQNPLWEDRDYVYLSNGHTCPVWYSALARSGFFDPKELDNFRQVDAMLQGHPHMPHTPGVENSGGPLGQGTSQAVGAAIGLQIQNKTNDVYCICSDGEHQEGQVWEAVMLAAKNKLNNLVFILDWNHIQIDGNTKDVSFVDEFFKERYEAFGWHTISIRNHNLQVIKAALDAARDYNEGPVIILADTVPGKGVSFMEDNYKWHGKAPTDDEYQQAMNELKNV